MEIIKIKPTLIINSGKVTISLDGGGISVSEVILEQSEDSTSLIEPTIIAQLNTKITIKIPYVAIEGEESIYYWIKLYDENNGELVNPKIIEIGGEDFNGD